MSDHTHDCKTCGGYFGCDDCDDKEPDERDCYDCLRAEVERLREGRAEKAEAEVAPLMTWGRPDHDVGPPPDEPRAPPRVTRVKPAPTKETRMNDDYAEPMYRRVAREQMERELGALRAEVEEL